MKHMKVILLAALVSAPFATRAQEAQKVQLDPSAWLVLSGFNDTGGFDANELARFAVPETLVTQKDTGYAVRQSRVRFAFTAPTDNLLAGATLKGLVEVDFVGGSASTTVDPTIIRMRHVFLSATWKQASNLTLTVGQTWGVAMPNAGNFASSLAHLAVPRFGGAGFLYRRAPQIRLAADLPAGPLTVNIAGGLLTPGDIGSAASNSAGNDSAFPNLEGRVAGVYKGSNAVKGVELGFLAHYGQKRYGSNVAFPGAAAGYDATATSQMLGLEGKLDFGVVYLVGGLWQGQSLDAYNSIAGLRATAGAQPSTRFGVVFDATNPTDPKAREIETEGAYGQVGITAVKNLLIVAGLGFENPKSSTLALPGAQPADGLILRNNQYSAAAILSLTSKWRVSFEATRFVTLTQNAATPSTNSTNSGNQFEIGSILAL